MISSRPGPDPDPPAGTGPTDWVSGERVFGPPAGTIDVDWLVPALLERDPALTAERARAVLAEAWAALRRGEPVDDASAAGALLVEAARLYGEGPARSE